MQAKERQDIGAADATAETDKTSAVEMNTEGLAALAFMERAVG
jgi:hypothetical protein